MVYRWRCRRCEFTVWATSQQAVVSHAKNHLFEHFKQTVGTGDSMTMWECPHCGDEVYGYDRDAVVEQIKEHLFTHYQQQTAANVHVFESIGGVGNVLLETGKPSPLVKNACLHLSTPSRIQTQGLLLVTADPTSQLQTWRKQLSTWPKSLTIITPREIPEDRFSDISSTVDIVTLGGGINLQKLGEAISQAIQSLVNSCEKIVVGFDILSEVLERFELKIVFRFLNILTRQFNKANAAAHFHLTTQQHSQVELNLVRSQFDLGIQTAENVLIRKS